MLCRRCDDRLHRQGDRTQHLRECTRTEETDMCASHMHPLTQYCKTCERSVCDDCASTGEHAAHETGDLKSVAAKIEKRMSNYRKVLEQICAETSSMSSNIEKCLGNAGVGDEKNSESSYLRNEWKQTARNSINQTFEKLHAALHKRRQELLTMVDNVYEEKKLHLLGQNASANNLHRSAHELLEKIEEFPPDREASLVSLYGELQEQLDNLNEVDIHTMIGPVNDLQVHTSFDTKDLDVLFSIVHTLGTVGEKGEAGRDISQNKTTRSRSPAPSSSIGSKGDNRPVGNIEESAPLSFDDLYVGMRVDALDTVNRWAEAEVLELDAGEREVLVSYVYWPSEWNEWLPVRSDVIAPLKTHTLCAGREICVGQRVEVCNGGSEWREAFVTNVNGYQVEVLYEDDKQKERSLTVDTRMDRIRQYGIAAQPKKKRASTSSSKSNNSKQGKKKARA